MIRTDIGDEMMFGRPAENLTFYDLEDTKDIWERKHGRPPLLAIVSRDLFEVIVYKFQTQQRFASRYFSGTRALIWDETLIFADDDARHTSIRFVDLELNTRYRTACNSCGRKED
jgi:hypothetical protein